MWGIWKETRWPQQATVLRPEESMLEKCRRRARKSAKICKKNGKIHIWVKFSKTGQSTVSDGQLLSTFQEEKLAMSRTLALWNCKLSCNEWNFQSEICQVEWETAKQDQKHFECCSDLSTTAWKAPQNLQLSLWPQDMCRKFICFYCWFVNTAGLNIHCKKTTTPYDA